MGHKEVIHEYSTTLWIKVLSTSYESFPIISYGGIVINGLYDKTASTMQIQMQLWDFGEATITKNFTHPPAFALDQWIFIGVSIFKTKRIGDSFDINIVTKTLAGVQNSTSFLNQDVFVECKAWATDFGDYNRPILYGSYHLLGFSHRSEKFMFTGLINKVLIYEGMKTEKELLDDATRLPVEKSSIYDPYLLHSLVIYNENSLEAVANRENLAESFVRMQYIPGHQIPDSVKVTFEDSPSDPINACQFHYIEKQCNWIDTSSIPEVFLSTHHFETMHGLVYNGASVVLVKEDLFTNNPRTWKMICNLTESEYIVYKSRNGFKSNGPNVFYFLKYDTKEIFSLGSINFNFLDASVYPDHGNSILGESEIYTFTVTSRNSNSDKISDKRNDSLFPQKISFSLDCEDIQPGDVTLEQQSDGTFPALDTSQFTAVGYYMICWKSALISSNCFIKASDSYWVIRNIPIVNSSQTAFQLNQNAEAIFFKELITIDDEFMLIKGSPDCDINNQIDTIFPSQSLDSIHIWFPDESLPLHLCWRRVAPSGFSSWIRIQSSSGVFEMTVENRTVDRRAYLKIVEFSHPINSIIYHGENFWFKISTDGRPIGSVTINSDAKIRIKLIVTSARFE